MRTCGTWSSISSRMLRSRPGIQVSVRGSGGPGGIAPKYLFTSSSARSGVMSPASEITALFGP
jgi:hypothetical protein